MERPIDQLDQAKDVEVVRGKRIDIERTVPRIPNFENFEPRSQLSVNILLSCWPTSNFYAFEFRIKPILNKTSIKEKEKNEQGF